MDQWKNGLFYSSSSNIFVSHSTSLSESSDTVDSGKSSALFEESLSSFLKQENEYFP